MSDVQLTSFDAMQSKLAELEKAGAYRLAGPWSTFHMLSHCAQSIEYSMTGYPQSKSAFFQSTIGRIALHFFLWRGNMSHNLTDPVPGAPDIANEGIVQEAFRRLEKAIADFRAFAGAPAPHFAYGAVTKAEYEKLHAMHFANHLSQLTAA